MGLLLDALYNEYASMVVAAFDGECARRGYDLLCFAGGSLHSLAGHELQRNRCFDLVSGHALDGLIILSLNSAASTMKTFLDSFRSLPMCSVGIEVEGLACVQADNASGIRDAMQHLITEHQRSRIGFLCGPSDNVEAEIRFRAYRDALAQFGIEYDPSRVMVANFDGYQGQMAMAELLDRGVSLDALVGANDRSALGAMRTLRERGLRVPEDIAVVGFDDSDEARGATPSLATVRQPYFDMAEAALEYIADSLARETAPRHVLLASHFVKRRSCGCLSEGAPADTQRELAADPLPFVEAFARRRQELSEELARAERTARVVGPEGWIDRALDALHAAILGAPDRDLLSLLDEMLARTAAVGGDADAWQHAVSGLRRCILPCVMGEPRRWMRFEDIWQRVRVLMADAVEREQRSLRSQAERSAGILTDTSESLITSFDVESLPRALADRLPALDIASAYVALYDGPGRPPPESQLIVAYEGRKLREIPSATARFPTREIVPPALRGQRRTSVVVEPLFFENRQLGYAVLELGPKRRVVYELLRELISAALRGAELVRRVAEEAQQRERAEKERLERELEIAMHIQTSILPRQLGVENLDIAAAMVPATEVGGDYYDVLPGAGGCWLGIGDVAGHGLRSGLVMMMLQSVLAALLKNDFNAAPRDVLLVANAVLYDSVRERLGQDEHATLTLLRYFANGELVFAGAHEEIVIFREQSRKCQRIATPGTWLGATRDIAEVTEDQRARLEDGDILLLYTDGAIEASDRAGHAYGLDRLCAELESAAREPVATIVERLLASVLGFLAVQQDDIALLVARYRKPGP
ncbi:MAG TPA: SpoIIE family protein phosphatase [Polyangiaceae bacterium]|jgi:sigma-B regulation protein RsbU (phosphoserine phosphatase)|nr:SpoIIE family protein phosphatase [Polyangiaceae bacterium]